MKYEMRSALQLLAALWFWLGALLFTTNSCAISFKLISCCGFWLIYRVVNKSCKAIGFSHNLKIYNLIYEGKIRIIFTCVKAGNESKNPPYNLIPTTRLEFARRKRNNFLSGMLFMLYHADEYNVSENSSCFDSTKSPKYERMNKFPRHDGRNRVKFEL